MVTFQRIYTGRASQFFPGPGRKPWMIDIGDESQSLFSCTALNIRAVIHVLDSGK